MFRNIWNFLFSKKQNTDDKLPTSLSVVLDLGSFQVLSYRSEEDIINDIPSDKYYFRDKKDQYAHGPFDSIADALNYSIFMDNQQLSPTKNEDGKEGDIIHVDFVNKRRTEVK